MAKPANDERLVIRMPKELREWIDAQADAAGGLDAATWVRMRLMQEMRGTLKPPVNPHAEYAAEEAARPNELVDMDALVDQGLAVAEAQGLTAPVESSDDGPQAETERIGAPSRATMRNLVGNGSARPW